MVISLRKIPWIAYTRHVTSPHTTWLRVIDTDVLCSQSASRSIQPGKKTSDSMLWQRIVDTATRRWRRSLPYHDCVQEWRNLTCCCEIRFGTSVGGRLLSALLCWPSPWVVLIGALASSIGAALQCLTSTHSTLWGRKKEPIFFCMHLFNIWQKLVIFSHILKNV